MLKITYKDKRLGLGLPLERSKAVSSIGPSKGDQSEDTIGTSQAKYLVDIVELGYLLEVFENGSTNWKLVDSTKF